MMSVTQRKVEEEVPAAEPEPEAEEEEAETPKPKKKKKKSLAAAEVSQGNQLFNVLFSVIFCYIPQYSLPVSLVSWILYGFYIIAYVCWRCLRMMMQKCICYLKMTTLK